MTETSYLSLSAMLDNEADELELRRVIKASETDPDLRNQWQRLNLAQALLHGQECGRVGGDFAVKVSALIDCEPAPSAFSWRQATAKIAIAASVAIVVFTGFQLSLQESTTSISKEVVQQLAPDTVQPAPALQIALGTESRAVDPVARQRLEDYINQVSITHESPTQLEYIQDSPLYRLVNDIQIPTLPKP